MIGLFSLGIFCRARFVTFLSALCHVITQSGWEAVCMQHARHLCRAGCTHTSNLCCALKRTHRRMQNGNSSIFARTFTFESSSALGSGKYIYSYTTCQSDVILLSAHEIFKSLQSVCTWYYDWQSREGQKRSGSDFPFSPVPAETGRLHTGESLRNAITIYSAHTYIELYMWCGKSFDLLWGGGNRALSASRLRLFDD